MFPLYTNYMGITVATATSESTNQRLQLLLQMRMSGYIALPPGSHIIASSLLRINGKTVSHCPPGEVWHVCLAVVIVFSPFVIFSFLSRHSGMRILVCSATWVSSTITVNILSKTAAYTLNWFKGERVRVCTVATADQGNICSLFRGRDNPSKSYEYENWRLTVTLNNMIPSERNC